MGQLISVRSNQDFSVKYEDNTLIPQTEIIILVEKPHYVLNKKGDQIIRKTIVEEIRFKASTEGLNQLIGKLQLASHKAASFEQMGTALNDVIMASKPKAQQEPSTE